MICKNIIYKKLVIILLAVLVVGCEVHKNRTIDNNQIRQDLVGHWYGKVTVDDGTIHHWIANHQVDGQLFLEFKDVKDTIITSRTSEEGLWFSEGDHFFSQINTWYSENGIRNETDLQHKYKIINVEPNRIVYSDQNYEYEAIRVDADFIF